MRLDDLIPLSDRLFSQQARAATFWQVLAENFAPQLADFTVKRDVGEDITDNLLDSYPVMMCRDLGDSFSAMLRDGSEWFEVWVLDEPDYAGKEWLEGATKRLQRLFSDHRSGFTRATKQGDHFYALCGQAVLSVEPNRNFNGLLIRNWHLRDCAWADGEEGRIEQVHRRWKPTLFELERTFGDKMHAGHKARRSTDPMECVEVRHIVMPPKLYGDSRFERFERVSVFIDIENKHILEEKGINYEYYVIPRFQTIAGSPYAISPATVTALPNARLLQAMTFTLMEAAERHARPPLIAQAQVTRSDIDLGPDGITWIDKDYDEKTGEALRTLKQDRGGFPIGHEMRLDVRDVLSSAFYLNRLSLPDVSREMTAYEVQERMKQYRRQNLPLFAPVEADYNGQLCEAAFKLALNMGLLGSPNLIPPSLRGQEIDWKFKSPLSAAEEERKVHQFKQTSELLAAAVEMDPMAGNDVDIRQAMRDAVEAAGSPTRWLRDAKEVLTLDSEYAQGQAKMIEMQAATEAA